MNSAANAKPRKVLIVEDQAILRLALSQTVRSAGHEIVATADTGEQAIALALQHQPDVVLMDIWLLSDMTGIEAAQVIREQSGIPSIFITALSASDVPDEIRGNSIVLNKPVMESDLQQVLEELFSVSKFRNDKN